MKNAIAIDLGGTQVRAAIVDENGEVLHRAAVNTRTHDGPDVITDQMADLAKSLPQKDVHGIGVSAPGPLDTETGMALGLPSIPGFTDFPLRASLSQKLGSQIRLENDGIAAAIGEWKFGAGRGLHSMVYITASTGIGGGVIVNNTVLRGRKGMAGHVGHLSIDHNGIRCNCGNTGCWERYAAGPFFAARASEALGKTVQPTDVFAMAREGHALAQRQVDEEARLMGVGITSLLHLYSPEKIIIGGGLSNALNQLLPGINAYIQDNAMPAFRDVSVVRAALAGNSGLIGAASLVFAN